MKHTYKITGMTCNNCRASVEEKLSAVEGTLKVSVNLEKGEAEISMKNHISNEKFSKALPSKYTISEKKETNIFENTSEVKVEEKSKIEQLKPLLLIFLYIAVASVLLNYNPWSTANFMMDFMGLFFIVFSFFKMLDLKGFPESFQMYDPVAKLIPAYGWIYPFLETALGLMFLMHFNIKIALIVTIIILGITTIGVTQTLLSKKKIKCACLGTALNLPMTEATFIENSIMLIMSVYMLLKIYL